MNEAVITFMLILKHMSPPTPSRPALVAEGMMRMITDSGLNGAVMKITCSKGIHYHTYEPLSA